MKFYWKIAFFLIFLSIQGVQGAIWEGPEPIQELKNDQIYRFFKIFWKSIKNWFEPINGDDFLRRISLSRLELPISEFSKKSKNFGFYIKSCKKGGLAVDRPRASSIKNIAFYAATLGPPWGPGPLGPGPLRPRAPGPGSLRPRAPEAQGPWARVLEAHRPRGPPMGDPPWDPWGDPPGIPGTPPGTPGAKKSVFSKSKKIK